MGRFVVDFYCPKLRLVIEIDGPSHQDAVEADRTRQSMLEATGLRFWRVTADEVEAGVDQVIERLRAWLE